VIDADINPHQSTSIHINPCQGQEPHMTNSRMLLEFINWYLNRLVTDEVVPRRLRDQRGAVSLEQVLWFVAAGVSVAVIAGIIWAQIMSQASTPINAPSAP
jgi:hypothetical protein